GALVGTPEYMAPEQAEARAEVGPACDVYALGAILYALLTGRPPFQAVIPLGTLAAVRSQEPVPPRQLNPAAPRGLATACLKCLRKEPQRRYASADELAEDLRRFLEGRPVTARPAGRLERTWRWCRRNPLAAALLAAAAAALLAAAGTLLGLAEERADRAEEKWRREQDRQARAAQTGQAVRKALAEAAQKRTRAETADGQPVVLWGE